MRSRRRPSSSRTAWPTSRWGRTWRGEGEGQLGRGHLLGDGSQLDCEVVLGGDRRRKVLHVQSSLRHRLPLPAGIDVLQDEEPVLVVVLLLVGVSEHGDQDVLVLRDRPDTHPQVGVPHGGLPAEGVADHPAGLPGPDDTEGGGLPIGATLYPQLTVTGRELELAGSLVDPVQSLPH